MQWFLSCPEDIAFCWSTLICDSNNLFFPPFHSSPCALGGRLVYGVDEPFMAGCSTDTYSLIFRVFHLGKQFYDERNYSEEEARKERD